MKYFILFSLLLIILCIIFCGKTGGKPENFTAKILQSVQNSDPERVHKYLEIKSGLKGKTNTEMINYIAQKKNIKTFDEFMERLNMGPYTFMTATEQFEFEEKLTQM